MSMFYSRVFPPLTVQWFFPQRLDTAVAHRAGSRERFPQPAIAEYRSNDAFSFQLLIHRLATER